MDVGILRMEGKEEGHPLAEEAKKVRVKVDLVGLLLPKDMVVDLLLPIDLVAVLDQVHL